MNDHNVKTAKPVPSELSEMYAMLPKVLSPSAEAGAKEAIQATHTYLTGVLERCMEEQSNGKTHTRCATIKTPNPLQGRLIEEVATEERTVAASSLGHILKTKYNVPITHAERIAGHISNISIDPSQSRA